MVNHLSLPPTIAKLCNTKFVESHMNLVIYLDSWLLPLLSLFALGNVVEDNGKPFARGIGVYLKPFF